MIKAEYSIMTGMNIYSDLREETLNLRTEAPAGSRNVRRNKKRKKHK